MAHNLILFCVTNIDMQLYKTKKKQSRSRRFAKPHDLRPGDQIRLTTNSMTDDFVVTQCTDLYVILENPNKQKVLKMSIQTGNIVDISPAFPIDVQNGQKAV